MLGNFVNRILKFTEARFDGVVPDGGEPGPLEEKLYTTIDAQLAELTTQMEAFELRKAAQAVRALWVTGNEYLAEAAPWTAVKTDRDRAAVIVRTGLNLVRLFAAVSAPFIPFAATTIAQAVGEDAPAPWPDEPASKALARLTPSTPIKTPDVLFKKIDADMIATWSERFGGAEAA